MKILYYDMQRFPEAENELGAEYTSFEDLLKESDFITLHPLYTPETHHLISTKELALMKSTAYLINASRGQVIVEEDLVKALQEKLIAGAGLDVFAEEPIDSSNPLLEFNNVIVSPHCAGNSKDALNVTALRLSQEVERILLNDMPKNIVNRSQLENCLRRSPKTFCAWL